MKRFLLTALILFPLFSQGAVLSQIDYDRMSAQAKQTHHLKEAQRTERWFLSTRLGSFCKMNLARLGFLSKSYLEPILEMSGSPTTFRDLFGKPIHRHGVTASGIAKISAGGGLFDSETEVPVTVRFSLANSYLPWVSWANMGTGLGDYRPGYMISFHRNGLPDLNLFIMPEAGLDGFTFRQNPLELEYSHRLKEPTQWLIRWGAKKSFGRIAKDPTQQELDPFILSDINGKATERPHISHQLFFKTPNDHAKAYEPYFAFIRSFGDDRRGLIKMPTDQRYRFFDVSGENIHGYVDLTSSWIASQHGDWWYAPHPGFERK